VAMKFRQIFFGCLQYPEIPVRQTSFLKVIKSHSEKIREIWWVFHFTNRLLGQKLLNRVRIVSWGIVMVEDSIAGTNFRPFFAHHLT